MIQTRQINYVHVFLRGYGKKSSDTRGRSETHRGGCWGNLHERDHPEDLGINGRIILHSSYNRDEKNPGRQVAVANRFCMVATFVDS
jgi:hypothetical protein